MRGNRFAPLVTNHQVQEFEALYQIRNELQGVAEWINEGHWRDYAKAFERICALAREAEEALRSPAFDAAYKQRRATREREAARAAAPFALEDDIPF